MSNPVHTVIFDRNDPTLRQVILMRFQQLSERIFNPTANVPVNPTAEVDNLFDLLEFGISTMPEPGPIGSSVIVANGTEFVKVGTDAWIKANPDTLPIFPVPWVTLINPRLPESDEESPPSEEPPPEPPVE